VNIDDLIAAELAWAAVKSVIYGLTIMLVVALFGLVDSPLLLLSVPVIFLCGLIFAEVSMITTALVPGIDSFSYFYTLFMTPLFLFSGVFLSRGITAQGGRRIAWFTPLYHLVNICRAFAAGHAGDVIGSIIWIAVVAAALAPVPFRLMRRRVIQ